MFSSPVKCTSSVTKASFFLHFLGCVWYSGGVYYDRVFRPDVPEFQVFGGRSQFLTHINLYMTFLATVFAFCVDLLQLTTNGLQPDIKVTEDGYAKNSSVLISIRDELISFWVYAGCTMVPILYWGLVIVDKDGIHSDEVEKRLPLFGFWNQFLHTVPLPYALILITFVNYESISVLRILCNCSAYILGYLLWMGYCAKQNGYWAYPVIQMQSTGQFVVFIGVCIMVLMILQLFGRKWASRVWNQQRCDYAIRLHGKDE